MSNNDIKQELLNLYEDYEKRRIGKYEIQNYVRDLYYLEHTGKTYDDWLEGH